MTPQEHIDVISEILIACRRCYAAGQTEEAWHWYAVFCEAWGRLRWQIPDTTPGAGALEYAIKRTQQFLKENMPSLLDAPPSEAKE